MVCTLSVFNGFQDVVATFFTAFDPELKITATAGKVFDGQDERILELKKLPEVAVFSESLEENAMVKYKGRQTMAVIKGVEDNFDRLTPIDSILFGRGELLLHDEVADYAIPGIELVSILGTGNFVSGSVRKFMLPSGEQRSTWLTRQPASTRPICSPAGWCLL